MTVNEIVDRGLSVWERGLQQPNRVAVVGLGGASITYGQLASRAHQWAHAMSTAGVEAGDTVALLAPNSVAFLEVVAAALESGVRLVPVNYHLAASEIAYILTDSCAALVVADDSVAETAGAAAAAANLPPQRCIAIGHISGFTDMSSIVDVAPSTPPDDRKPGQRTYYTSGTTGRPKGVIKRAAEGDVDRLAVAQSARLFDSTGRGVDESTVTMVPGPLYHAAPMGAAWAALQLGHLLVVMERFDAEAALSLIERYHVTSTTMVPTMFVRMLQLDQTIRDKYDVSSLRQVAHAGAPCPVDVKRRMIEWLGPIINEYYAASEGGGTRVSSEEWLQRPGTVGRATPGGDIKILGDDGNELAPGETGRVFMLMREPFHYHNDAEKTAGAIVGDYFTVGDIGYLDDDGYLFLRDRSADVIISGGVNIYPAEAEAALLGHDAVRDAAVVGVPDPDWGEAVRAVVQLMPGIEPSDHLAHELIAHCQERLSKFKCPRAVDFVADLPRLDNGKLYKRMIRDRYWTGSDRAI